MVRDARRCRAPHHEGPHPEEAPTGPRGARPDDKLRAVSRDETPHWEMLWVWRLRAIRGWWRLRPPLSFCYRLALFFARPMSVRNASRSLRTALAASRSILR